MPEDGQEVPLHADAYLPRMRTHSRPRPERRAQHLAESVARYRRADGNLRLAGKRLGRSGRYCLVRDGIAASHLAEPGTPCALAMGVSVQIFPEPTEHVT